MAKAYISLGSNMGNKIDNLQRAIFELSQIQEISVTAVSSVYRTAPMGYTEQDWFLNAVAELEVSVEAPQLLKTLLAVESKLGRVRIIHWGPRVIDLDLLLYNDEILKEKDIEVPHPRLTERAFVLVPLLEINPDLKLPSGALLKGFMDKIDYEVQKVTKISEKLGCTKK